MNIEKIKSFSFYSLSVYIAKLFLGISTIIVKNILGPVLTGKFAFLNMLYRYMTYGHLGIRFSVDRNLPSMNEEDNKKIVKEFEMKSLTSVLFLEIILFIIIGFLVSVFYDPPTSKILIYIVLLGGVFFSINEMFKVIYRAEKKVMDIAKYTLTYYLFFSIIQVFIVYFFGFNELIFSILLYNILFLFIYFIIIKKEKVSIKIDFLFLTERVKDGFPLFVNGLIMFTLLNIDKWFILSYFNEKQLGYYSVATMFFTMFMIMPNSLSEVLFPDLIVKIGNEPKVQVIKDLIKDIKFLSEIFYVLISFFIFLIPFFIKIIMPEYLPSITISRILVVGIFSFAITSLGKYLLMGLNEKRMILTISSFSLLLAVTLNYLFLNYLQMSVYSIATASAITYIFYGLFYLIFIIKISDIDIKNELIPIVINLIKLLLFLLINILNFSQYIYIILVIFFVIDLVRIITKIFLKYN